MKVTRIYTGADGKSHFEEMQYDLRRSGVGMLSESIPVKGMILRETPADYDLDFHPAPRCQFVINLDAAVEIEVGDGSKRVLGPGEIFLAEDTTGQGHISRAVDGKVRHSIFVTLE
ncbi:MAG: hypothetical protein O3B04_07485 [Chloroflexi bacterium]|nr:hypothetical protein [Chloroflexota bacterium]